PGHESIGKPARADQQRAIGHQNNADNPHSFEAKATGVAMSSVRGHEHSETVDAAGTRPKHRCGRLSSRLEQVRHAVTATSMNSPLRRASAGLATCLMYHPIVADEAAPRS